MDAWQSHTQQALESDEPLELSLVELVVATCELSEDETEVGDLVDRYLASGQVLVERAA